MKTLYVTDLDGTLLDAEGRVSARSAALLNEAIAGGAAFTVATARTPATVAPLLADVDMRLPAVVMTGAALWNPKTGIYSDPRYISREAVDDLIEIYTREGVGSFLYTLRDNHIDIYHLGSLSPQEKEFMRLREGTPFKDFHIPPEDALKAGILPREHVVLLFAMQEKEPVCRVYDRVCEAGVDCSPLHYHDTYGPESELMEVFSPSATKGKALRRLRERLGVERMVVFGDQVNDIPMMKEADWAVAVENAVPEVKAAANEIIGANTEDSVSRYIRAHAGS
ncbi:MAG: HAD family phosphatase [Bacteroides sp.]|nr:HAD family phosphatase [Bacteroides sp.]